MFKPARALDPMIVIAHRRGNSRFVLMTVLALLAPTGLDIRAACAQAAPAPKVAPALDKLHQRDQELE
jgi:hypothetical protein